MPQVVIRSKITGQCPKCPQIIQDGDPIAILLGEWMHVECKAASLAAKITFTTEVPTVMYYQPPQVTQRRLGGARKSGPIRSVTSR